MVQPCAGGNEERASVRQEAAGHLPALAVRAMLILDGVLHVNIGGEIVCSRCSAGESLRRTGAIGASSCVAVASAVRWSWAAAVWLNSFGDLDEVDSLDQRLDKVRESLTSEPTHRPTPRNDVGIRRRPSVRSTPWGRGCRLAY